MSDTLSRIAELRTLAHRYIDGSHVRHKDDVVMTVNARELLGLLILAEEGLAAREDRDAARAYLAAMTAYLQAIIAGQTVDERAGILSEAIAAETRLRARLFLSESST